MRIVEADKTNFNDWVRLWHELFSEHTIDDAIKECADFLNSKKEIGFLCEQDGRYIGFMNISIRHDYVNGTDSSPVVYIEAIYVEEDYRKRGVARKFIEKAEEYANGIGCKEIASDCLIQNTTSEQFHKNCGFQEVERVICFVKKLNDED